MIVTAVLETAVPVRLVIISAISGVATEKVVAVPASRANSANMSMKRPNSPSAIFPITGRQASLYRCLFRFLTCSIKPNATASTR